MCSDPTHVCLKRQIPELPGRLRILESGFKAYIILFEQGGYKTQVGHFTEQQALREVDFATSPGCFFLKGTKACQSLSFQAGCSHDSSTSRAGQSLGHTLKMIHYISIMNRAPLRVSAGAEVKAAGTSGPWTLLPHLFSIEPRSLVSREEKLTSMRWQKERNRVLSFTSGSVAEAFCPVSGLRPLPWGNQPLPQGQFGDHSE